MKQPVISLLLALLCAVFGVQASSGDILIFATRAWPVQVRADNITVYTLALPDELAASLFGALPSDPQTAGQQARLIMASPEWQQKEQRLYSNAEGVTKAWSLGLQKFPAVVIDSQYVVYGTTDIALAQQKLAEFRGRK